MTKFVAVQSSEIEFLVIFFKNLNFEIHSKLIKILIFSNFFVGLNWHTRDDHTYSLRCFLVPFV